MIRTRILTKSRSRRGFTLIELLVVISIIAVLASLIAPAVQSARRTARKIQCLNNIRQVGIAFQAVASNSGGQLPPLQNDIAISNANGTGFLYGAGWPIAILPAIDQTAVLKNIKTNAVNLDTTSPNRSFNINNTANGENIWIPVFTCPDDNDSDHRAGGLSYVVNAGFIPSTIFGFGGGAGSTNLNGPKSAEVLAPMNRAYSPALATGPFLQPYLVDWNGNGTYSVNGIAPLPNNAAGFDSDDQHQQVSTGVFTRTTGAAGSVDFVSSIDYVASGDGTSSTILLAENLQAGPWNGVVTDAVNGNGSTASRYFGVNHLGFGFRLPVDAAYQPVTNVLAPVSASSIALSPGTLFTDKSVNPDTWIINNNLAAAVGSAPRPSSQHQGGVNVVMCDGSGRYINESIDASVYLKLITSNGVTYGERTLDNNF